MKILGILLLLFTFSIPTYAGDDLSQGNYVVRDKDYQIQNYVRNGRIYDKDYSPQGYATRDGRIRDNDYNTRGYWKTGSSYDNHQGGTHSRSGRHR